MDKTQKLVAALKSAVKQAPQAFGDQMEAMLQPEALLQFAVFTSLFIALQATPAGWATDLAVIGLEAYLIGPLVFQALSDLVEFCDKATSAQDQPTIDQAGHALADALGILGIALLMKLLFHEGGKVEPEEAPSGKAEIKPKSAGDEAPAEKTPPADKPSDAQPGGEGPSPPEVDTGPKIVEEEPSIDGQRTVKVTETGECEVCASPCQDIRAKYAKELTDNPDLAKRLDDAARLTDPKAQEAEFRDIEQQLATKQGTAAPQQGPQAPAGRVPAVIDPTMSKAKPAEQATAKRLAANFPEFDGRTFKMPDPPDNDFDWTDEQKTQYDAMGDGTKAQFFNLKQFTDAIDGHLVKSGNLTIIDMTGFTADQIAAVKQYVDALPASKQALIRRIGF
jgi:hypothetical protein